MRKLAVGVSGAGSNLKAIVAARLPVGFVFADRPCAAVEWARKNGIETKIIDRSQFGVPFDRESFTWQMANACQDRNTNIIALAGFMTIFHPIMFERYGGCMLNIHPSLLPAFPGAHAVRDALRHGVKVTGCTVHEVVAEVDAGKILVQAAVSILPGDTEAWVHRRIQQQDHITYPRAIERRLREIKTNAR